LNVKKLAAILLIMGCVACAVKHNSVRIDPVKAPIDSVEYRLVITEPGYDSWMATHSRPEWYYSDSYYKNWNQLFVIEWNERARTRGYQMPYEYTIEYENRIDYGFEVEYQLYWFFRFIEQKYNVDLMRADRF
jgi:hypothetical protein